MQRWRKHNTPARQKTCVETRFSLHRDASRTLKDLEHIFPRLDDSPHSVHVVRWMYLHAKSFITEVMNSSAIVPLEARCGGTHLRGRTMATPSVEPTIDVRDEYRGLKSGASYASSLSSILARIRVVGLRLVSHERSKSNISSTSMLNLHDIIRCMS